MEDSNTDTHELFDGDSAAIDVTKMTGDFLPEARRSLWTAVETERANQGVFAAEAHVRVILAQVLERCSAAMAKIEVDADGGQ